jgi:transposase InsO family protein
VLKRNGLNRLPRNSSKHRAQLRQRYEKQVPGHHVQVDVKFLNFTDRAGKPVRRYQYTAIDDATRIRALKVYARHTQENAMDFVNHVVEKFPFRISTIRTDNGHEFQSLFHRHVEDLGMKHTYIRVRTPRLNGKVERSHRTDKEEFYQLLTYTGDVDLNVKLEERQNFYNYHRPHSAPGRQDAVRDSAREAKLERSRSQGRMTQHVNRADGRHTSLPHSITYREELKWIAVRPQSRRAAAVH